MNVCIGCVCVCVSMQLSTTDSLKGIKPLTLLTLAFNLLKSHTLQTVTIPGMGAIVIKTLIASY